MIVYRFASEQYKDDISGNGAALYGGRWNSKGTPLLYTSNHISLCLLELLVHNGNFLTLRSPFLISLSIPDTLLPQRISSAELPDSWRSNEAYTRRKGDQFLRESDALLLQVPSCIILQEYNFLINPLHRDFKKIMIVHSVLFELDKRLLGR